MASGVFLALGFADLAVLNLLLAPRLAEQAAAHDPRSPRGGEAAVITRPAHPAAPESACPPASAIAATAAPPAATAAPPTATAAANAGEGGPRAEGPGEATAAIVFELGEVRVPGGRAGDVRRVADTLRAAPDRRLLLRGHADRLGSLPSNLKLSRERAEAVRHLLSAYGAPVDRVGVEAVGEAEPASADDTPAGWALNRRVQLLWR